MNKYRNNHYVPVWYQELFFPAAIGERKFFYLDKNPETILSNGCSFKRRSILRWGAKKCFSQKDLYTTKYGSWISTEIEEKFFGPLDAYARTSLDYFSNFTHPSADSDQFQRLILYMSIQKLRTPKGLAYLSELTRQIERNQILIELQRLQQIFCAIWSESIWSIVDASQANTKFILSDHPVTVYNKKCSPESKFCRAHRDPDIWLTGTHTLFPLNFEKMLIITNLSWVRNPYGNPIDKRPNHYPFRGSMFNFTEIQTGRKLSDNEVIKINYLLKKRAYRYVAAVDKSWLFPENNIDPCKWNQFGDDYLLMPDPRSVSFSGETIIGYKDRADFFDSYGRKPWQAGYNDTVQRDQEWGTFHAFQGEYARRFGPLRRGSSFVFGGLTDEDSEEFHKYHIGLESRYNSPLIYS